MWYYFSLVALIFRVFICTRVVHSWMGRCFAAIRLNDELADSLGINVFRYKLISFLIGNAGAAVAGALYGYYLSYIEPNYLSIEQSLAIIAMVLLGRRQPVAGPISAPSFSPRCLMLLSFRPKFDSDLRLHPHCHDPVDATRNHWRSEPAARCSLK